ncbi:MAG: hypothetical protein Kow0074_04580 [Candidatus Zixiibacteriota bacterium]
MWSPKEQINNQAHCFQTRQDETPNRMTSDSALLATLVSDALVFGYSWAYEILTFGPAFCLYSNVYCYCLLTAHKVRHGALQKVCTEMIAPLVTSI